MRSESAQEAYFAAGYSSARRRPDGGFDLTDANSLPDPCLTCSRIATIGKVDQILAAQQSAGYPRRLFSQALLDDPGMSMRAHVPGWRISGDRRAGHRRIRRLHQLIWMMMTMTERAGRRGGRARRSGHARAARRCPGSRARAIGPDLNGHGSMALRQLGSRADRASLTRTHAERLSGSNACISAPSEPFAAA